MYGDFDIYFSQCIINIIFTISVQTKIVFSQFSDQYILLGNRSQAQLQPKYCDVTGQ